MDRRRLKKYKSSLHSFPSLSSQLSTNNESDSNSQDTGVSATKKRKISNTELLISLSKNKDQAESSVEHATKRRRTESSIIESPSIPSTSQNRGKRSPEKRVVSQFDTPVSQRETRRSARMRAATNIPLVLETSDDDDDNNDNNDDNNDNDDNDDNDNNDNNDNDDDIFLNQQKTKTPKRMINIPSPKTSTPFSPKATQKQMHNDSMPSTSRKTNINKKRSSDAISPNISTSSKTSSNSDTISSPQRMTRSRTLMGDVTPIPSTSKPHDSVDVGPGQNKIKKKKIVEDSGSKRQTAQKLTKFGSFLKECGILLKPDGRYKLDDDVLTIKKRIKEALYSEKHNKNEIIKFLEEHIEDDQNLQSMLTDIELHTNYESFNEIHNLSLARILLQIQDLQTDVSNSLLHKLNDSILCSDSTERLPWAQSILQQFRFLEVIVNADALNDNLEQLLESCPSWFQKEVMLLIPDIVTDTHHHRIADILSKLLEESPDLTAPILNCISSLTLGEQYLEDYKDKMLNLLKRNLEISLIPDILKFLFNNCSNLESFKDILTVLRCVEMQPLAGETSGDCYKYQMHVVNLLRMNLLSSKDMVQAAISVIKRITKEPKPLDVILLLLISSMGSSRRKTVETIFRNNVQCGIYRLSILHVLYNDYKEVIQSTQTEVLYLACNLLKSEEHAFIEFATEWFRLMFVSQENTNYKQREIVEKIILLIGSNHHSAKNALNLLRKMITKEDEKHCLQTHSNHLQILLEKMDNLDLEEVGMLNDLLHGLCTNSNSSSESLRNDLFILLQKQISNTKPLTKCKGVLGAVMAMKHMSQNSEMCSTAHSLFKKVLAAVKNCPRSHALFYDQLEQIIAQTSNISEEFLREIIAHVEEEFVSVHMIDFTEYSGELTAQYGLNNPDEESGNCVISFENKKFGAIVPITFRLLKTCNVRLSENGNLEAVDALLGAAVLMPQDLDVPEPSTLNLLMCCINWFREIISGFVTQTDQLLQSQILKRLDNLMHLQENLSILLTMCDTKYQPPPCYFHYFPIPPFVKIEKKSSKKGKKKSAEKSVQLRDEVEDVSSTLCAKNPAYFRRLDAKIACLLDAKMEFISTSQSASRIISMTQACFLVKELLAMFENEPDETFVIDIVRLLPKICAKLQDVVARLREEDNNQNKEAVGLLLRLITMIFNWKGFESITYNTNLRDALRTLAGLINKSNAMLRSCKELVAESCKYIESLCDIATRISLATILVNTCKSLMKHSETYVKHHKENHAKMAFGFLSLVWSEDKHTGQLYKTSITALLNHWVDNEPLPLDTISMLLDWLPDEVASLKTQQDTLSRLPSINKGYFHLLYKKTFDGVVKGVKIAVSLADSDSKRIEVWQTVASCVQKITQICKTMKTKANILIFLRHMPTILKLFLNTGMPVLEHNLKYQTEDVTKIVKLIQGSTRHLHAICCDGTERKDVTLTKYIPAAKAILERLIYSVKGMLVLNNSTTAFWMGNLVNKNLDGVEILSQVSEESALPDLVLDDVTNESSEILGSDLEEDPEEESNSAHGSDDANDDDDS